MWRERQYPWDRVRGRGGEEGGITQEGAAHIPVMEAKGQGDVHLTHVVLAVQGSQGGYTLLIKHWEGHILLLQYCCSTFAAQGFNRVHTTYSYNTVKGSE